MIPFRILVATRRSGLTHGKGSSRQKESVSEGSVSELVVLVECPQALVTKVEGHVGQLPKSISKLAQDEHEGDQQVLALEHHL